MQERIIRVKTIDMSKHIVYIQAFGKKYRSEIEANSQEEAESIAINSAKNQIKIAPEIDFIAQTPEYAQLDALMKYLQCLKDFKNDPDFNDDKEHEPSVYLNRLKELARKRGYGDNIINMIDEVDKER